MPDRVLILCAGRASRWTPGGEPKHLVRLCGEPILHRTVRQVLERVSDADVRVVVADTRDPNYVVPGARRAQAKLAAARLQADKFLSSRHLWNRTGRTIILLGDVFFTDEAMDTIVADRAEWSAFARFEASEITGCGHRELFAFVLHPEDHEHAEASALRCLDIAQRGLMGGWSGGWQFYAALAGAPDDEVGREFQDRGHIVDVDDWTDDFDYAADWHRWCRRYALAKRAGRPVPTGKLPT